MSQSLSPALNHSSSLRASAASTCSGTQRCSSSSNALELQEQVLGLAHGGLRARDRRDGVLELERRVRRAAALARVAVLIRRAAVRARALDVAVRQEHLPLLVVRLLDRLARDEAAGREPPIELGRELLVLGRVRRQVVVDADAVSREVALVLGRHALDEHVGRGAFLLGAQHRRRAVRVARANVQAAVTAKALEAHPDVRLNVLDDVSQVQRAVRVRQGARNEDGALGGQTGGLRNVDRQRPLLPRGTLCRGQGCRGRARRGQLSLTCSNFALSMAFRYASCP